MCISLHLEYIVYQGKKTNMNIYDGKPNNSIITW